MPKGVYPRTKNQLEAAKRNFALGRMPEVRKKVALILKQKAADPAWREKVSLATRKAMRTPEIRERHLNGLKRALRAHGVNFKGGNGQEPTELIKQIAGVLEPQGFIQEYAVLTKKQIHNFQNVPYAYKVDFGNPKLKIAIEMDGPCHRGRAQQIKDQKKTRTLQALGWIVLRYLH